MKLIAGLGNPGPRYQGSRHNIGFAVLDRLAEIWAGEALGRGGWSNRFKGLLLSTRQDGEQILLLKPQTFMNLSGESLQAVAAFYRLHPRDMIVVHDDMDLTMGRLGLKQGGGHGGHNGLRSISEALGKEYVRIRLGVGRPQYDAVNHVLGRFADDEHEAVDKLVEDAVKAIKMILQKGMPAAQNHYNKRRKKKVKKAEALPDNSKNAEIETQKSDFWDGN